MACERAHLHTQARHVQRARHGFAGDVGNDDAGASIAVVEEVEVIAADDASSRVAFGDAVAADVRRRLRQEALLDAAGERQIVCFDGAFRRTGSLRCDQPAELPGDADEQFVIAGAPRMCGVDAVELKRAEYLIAEADRHAEHGRRKVRKLEAGSERFAVGRVDDRNTGFVSQRLAQEHVSVGQFRRFLRAAALGDAGQMAAAGIAGVDGGATRIWKCHEQRIERECEQITQRFLAPRQCTQIAEQFEPPEQFAQTRRLGRRR
jgi:hypothetical protein